MKIGIETLMERAEFLNLCKEVSTYPAGICGIIEQVPSNLTVKVGTFDFYPLGYKLTFLNGKTQHTAILHDLKDNSIIECDLKEVKQ